MTCAAIVLSATSLTLSALTIHYSRRRKRAFQAWLELRERG